MARISAEDCLEYIESSFALVHVAVRRARQLQLGSKPLVQKAGDKITVTALREIAAGLVEQIPLSEKEQEEPLVAGVTEQEIFEQILESPDLNVQLDMDLDELEDTPSKKKTKDRMDEKNLEDFEEEIEDEEEEEEEE